MNFINFSYVIFWGQNVSAPPNYILFTYIADLHSLVAWKSSSNISMTHRDTSFVETRWTFFKVEL